MTSIRRFSVIALMGVMTMALVAPAFGQGNPVTINAGSGTGSQTTISGTITLSADSVTLNASAEGTTGPDPALLSCDFELVISGETALEGCSLP
jgi:hypothetical protein